MVVASVEELLDHGLRGSGSAGDALGAAVQVNPPAHEVDRDVGPQVADGVLPHVTVGTGWVVLKMRRESVLRPEIYAGVSESGVPEGDAGSGVPKPDRLVHAMRTAMGDFVDTAMYFSIGVAITSLFKAYVTEDLVVLFNQSEYVGINLMMILAFVLSIADFGTPAIIGRNFRTLSTIAYNQYTAEMGGTPPCAAPEAAGAKGSAFSAGAAAAGAPVFSLSTRFTPRCSIGISGLS